MITPFRAAMVSFRVFGLMIGVGAALPACNGSELHPGVAGAVSPDATPDATDAPNTARPVATGPVRQAPTPVNPNSALPGTSTPGDSNVTTATPGACDAFAMQTGQACTDTFGAGVYACVAGKLVCQACAPGQTRDVACGCTLKRHDVCSDTGTWLQGLCQGCPPPVTQCNERDACTPGKVQLRRCDGCTGAGCGATCVGAQWQCNDSCEWVQLSACQPREAECDRDVKRVDTCGLCGSQAIVCDGCFWSYETCSDQGVCRPGVTENVPCAGQSCAAGFTGHATCNDKCAWDVAATCDGCTVGTTDVQGQQACTGGSACGSQTLGRACVASSVPSCGDTARLTQGVWSPSKVLSSTCDRDACRPGKTTKSACFTSTGAGGTSTTTCAQDCTWGEPAACVAGSNSCVPGTIRNAKTLSCGANSCGKTYSQQEVCNAAGSGWSTQTLDSACPQCMSGTQQTTSCATPSGHCGSKARSCDSTCAWSSFATCQELPSVCTMGAKEVVQRPCPGSCATYPVTRTCTDGCGWHETGAQTACDNSCAANSQETEACTTADGRCGTTSRGCDGTCHQGTWSACQPKADACKVGSVQQRACTYACGLQGKQEVRCNGCGFDAVGVCVPDDANACTPGATTTLEACPFCPGTHHTLECGSSCAWVDKPCVRCG